MNKVEFLATNCAQFVGFCLENARFIKTFNDFSTFQIKYPNNTQQTLGCQSLNSVMRAKEKAYSVQKMKLLTKIDHLDYFLLKVNSAYVKPRILINCY